MGTCRHLASRRGVSKPPLPALGPSGEGVIPGAPHQLRSPAVWAAGLRTCVLELPQAAVMQPLGSRPLSCLPAPLLSPFWSPGSRNPRTSRPDKSSSYLKTCAVSSAFSETTMESQRQWDNRQLRRLHALNYMNKAARHRLTILSGCIAQRAIKLLEILNSENVLITWLSSRIYFKQCLGENT